MIFTTWERRSSEESLIQNIEIEQVRLLQDHLRQRYESMVAMIAQMQALEVYINDGGKATVI